MGNDYLTAIVNLVDPDRTLVALSAISVVDTNSVKIANIGNAFDQWLTEQANVSETDLAFPNWSDVTVAVSGAGDIEPEAQEVVLSFLEHDRELSGLTVLFLKRTTPGSVHWQVIADDMERAQT